MPTSTSVLIFTRSGEIATDAVSSVAYLVPLGMTLGNVKAILLKAKEIFLDFASKTSIHGVKYFGCPDRNWCEKFFWITVFALSVCSGALQIRKVYEKWDQTPVIVSFDEKFTPVWQIPFPAVTICPEAKTPISVLNFTREFHRFVDQFSKRNHQARLEEF